MMKKISNYELQAESAMPETISDRYVRRLQPDPGGGYTATIHEFPGCIAEGDTADEALSNLETTALSWLRSAKSSGYSVSLPVDFDGASGKLALRISRRIHQMAAERAELEGVSLNQFIGIAVASYLGQQDGLSRMAQQLEMSMRAHSQFTLSTSRAGPPKRERSSIQVIRELPLDSRTRFTTISSANPINQLVF